MERAGATRVSPPEERPHYSKARAAPRNNISRLLLELANSLRLGFGSAVSLRESSSVLLAILSGSFFFLLGYVLGAMFAALCRRCPP